VEQTSFALDTIKDTQTTIFAMKAAAGTLKAEHKKIDLNDIENMQDDLEGMALYVLNK
jgi:charged multivesicular body protein 5